MRDAGGKNDRKASLTRGGDDHILDACAMGISMKLVFISVITAIQGGNNGPRQLQSSCRYGRSPV
jgi:hypothetical protein